LQRANHLEEILGHLIYLKIIKELAISEKPLTKYRITVRTGLKSVDVKKALMKLIEIGWVMEHNTKPKKYSLNYQNPLAKKLVKCLKELGYIQVRSSV